MPRQPIRRTDNRVAELRDRIRELDRAYYSDSRPLVEDSEYDQLFNELKQLELADPSCITPDSPTQRVSETPVDGLERVQHTEPMLSIENCFTIEELDAWHQQVVAAINNDSEILFCVEYKIDGAAVCLRYEHGVLVQAATRGNGTEGDDIIHNARTFRGLPLSLPPAHAWTPPDILEIRGEAFMLYDEFGEFKDAEEAAGREAPSNPRNSASGAIRLLEATECHRRKIRFQAHGVGHTVPLDVKCPTHGAFLDRIHGYGIPCVHSEDGLLYDQVPAKIEQLIEMMPQLNYPIDGIVVKVDRRDQQMLLGTTGRHPNWCRAYKWERYEEETTVRDITIQVGKTGALTPVAELEPVEIAETMVSRASLFNKDEIARLDVRIGDRVVVEKAGKIIPHIVRVEKSGRGREIGLGAMSCMVIQPEPYEFPMTCPDCGSPAEQDDGGVYIRCTNSASCPAQLQATVEHFCSRKCMDIRGVGPTLIKHIVQREWFHDVADLYGFLEHRDELLELPKVGEKKRDKILEQLEASKQQSMDRWLAGLNVRHLGSTASRTLARRLGTIIDVLGATRAEMLALPGVGRSLVDSWTAFADSDRGKSIISRLLAAGLSQGEPAQEGDVGVFDGQTIVVTGALQNFDREAAKSAIRENGGRPSSSVSKNTSFIVAGSAPGAKKIEKATALSIPIINEDVFMQRLQPTAEPPFEPDAPEHPAREFFE